MENSDRVLICSRPSPEEESAVLLRHETSILGRVVLIRAVAPRQYEISMEGRGGFEIDPHPSPTIHEAKIQAHAFVHSTLKQPCDCGELLWVITSETELSA
jgi:hypothetical protein